MADRRSVVNGGADPVAVGSLPPLGEVPARMHAQVVRPARYGEPSRLDTMPSQPSAHAWRNTVAPWAAM